LDKVVVESQSEEAYGRLNETLGDTHTLIA
jgi:hypothetical protein